MSNFPTIPVAPVLTAAQIGPRCLVTGGAGYLGRALVKRLADAGCQVRSLDVMPHQQPAGVEVLTVDLRHVADLQKACQGVDTVFHTAALISILSTYRQSVKDKVMGVNVEGTKHLLDAAQSAGVRALVHTSSFNVALHHNAAGRVQDETAPYVEANKDLYSISKIAGEKAVLAANGKGKLHTCALRPGGIWGSDTQSIMIKSFLTQLAAGKFTVLVGDKQGLLDNTHVENLVDAMLLAAARLHEEPQTVGGQAYNVTDNETVNGMEWFRPLAEGLGYPFPTKWLPLGMMKMVASGMEWAHFFGAGEPLLTVRGIGNLSGKSCLSNAKAQRDLGYVPRYNRANGMPALVPAARRFVESQKK